MSARRTDRSRKEVLQVLMRRHRTHEGREYRGICGARNLGDLYTLFERVQRGELEITREKEEIERTFGLSVTEYVSITQFGLAQRGFSGVEVVLRGETMHVRMRKAEGSATAHLEQAVSDQVNVEGGVSAEIAEKRRDNESAVLKSSDDAAIIDAA